MLLLLNHKPVTGSQIWLYELGNKVLVNALGAELKRKSRTLELCKPGASRMLQNTNSCRFRKRNLQTSAFFPCAQRTLSPCSPRKEKSGVVSRFQNSGSNSQTYGFVRYMLVSVNRRTIIRIKLGYPKRYP